MSVTCNLCDTLTPDDSALCASCHEKNVCVKCGAPKGVYPRLCPACFKTAFNNSKPLVTLISHFRSIPSSTLSAEEGINIE